jgi:mannose-6-phosphate isomerase-like protein (cupin superfamily)
MVSLAERARTSPSIGTLVAICDTLSISIPDLFSPSPEPTNPVVRRGDQLVQPPSNGMTRRLLIKEDARGLETSEHEYVGRGATSGPVLTHHSGFEIGIIISGALRVELAHESYVLRAGDCIRFVSSTPHRFTNEIPGRTKAIWMNVKSDLDHRALAGLGIEPTTSNDRQGGS